MNTYEYLCDEIRSLTFNATINAPTDRNARDAYFKNVVGDIFHAICNTIGYSEAHRVADAHPEHVGMETRREMCGTCRFYHERHAEDWCDDYEAKPQGMAKFLTVADGVQLVRFKGKDRTQLSARRVGRSGNPNTIFEVVVYHDLTMADVFKDDEILFTIHGLTIGHNKVEKIAVSALHRYLKDQRPSKNKRMRIAREKMEVL